MNEYPKVMITRERTKARSKRREIDASQPEQTVDGEEKDMKTISIPYIKGTSEAIRRLLGPLGIQTAMRSTKMKWSILQRVKDKLKKNEIPRVVYAIGCTDCKEVYIGETRRTAAQRTKEHRSETLLGHIDK